MTSFVTTNFGTRAPRVRARLPPPWSKILATPLARGRASRFLCGSVNITIIIIVQMTHGIERTLKYVIMWLIDDSHGFHIVYAGGEVSRLLAAGYRVHQAAGATYTSPASEMTYIVSSGALNSTQTKPNYIYVATPPSLQQTARALCQHSLQPRSF